eukprot:TRINITY_DN19891_c0_g2_i1.p1 TRINITY_DN19891_c0_g2~~TRINITY_DN19891_c0_g2_i1.p1  ORF type:complete len:947 (+),score=169.12 TRINITY_DN19891_c0_g2_i1:57-2897(+)
MPASGQFRSASSTPASSPALGPSSAPMFAPAPQAPRLGSARQGQTELADRLAQLREQLQNSALYRPKRPRRRAHAHHDDGAYDHYERPVHRVDLDAGHATGSAASRPYGSSRRHRSRRSLESDEEHHREGRRSRRRKSGITLQQLSHIARAGDVGPEGVVHEGLSRSSRRESWHQARDAWDEVGPGPAMKVLPVQPDLHAPDDEDDDGLTQAPGNWDPPGSFSHHHGSRSRSRRHRVEDYAYGTGAGSQEVDNHTEARHDIYRQQQRRRDERHDDGGRHHQDGRHHHDGRAPQDDRHHQDSQAAAGDGYGYGYGLGGKAPQPQQPGHEAGGIPAHVADLLEDEEEEEEDMDDEDDEFADLESDDALFAPLAAQEGQLPEALAFPEQSPSPRTPDLPDFGLEGDDAEDDREAAALGGDPEAGERPVADEVACVDPYELADSDDGELFAAFERVAAGSASPPDGGQEASQKPSPQAEGAEDGPEATESAAKTPAAPSPPSSSAAAVKTASASPPAAAAASTAAPAAAVARPAAGATPSAPSRPAKKAVVNDQALVAGWQALLSRTRRHPDFPAEYTSCFANEGKNWLRATRDKGRFVLGIDCEMVYAKDDADALARVSVVSCSGVIYDAHVRKKPEDVLDFRTRISGVEAHHLLPENGALPFEEVQKQVLDLISAETILVGHSLHKDLRALRIQHTKIVDTALVFGVQGSQRRRHKLNSLVTLMRPKIATLQPVRPGAHDPRQDAQWALQLALYEASIFPRSTEPLKLQSFPKTIFLSEIPKGTTNKDLQAFFARGTCAEVQFTMQTNGSKSKPTDYWYGATTVTFPSQADRDKAFAALSRFVRVYVGPLRDWAGRTDVAKMQSLLLEHFSKFGRFRGCRVMCPRSAQPFGLLECHPTAARAILTNRQAQSFAGHSSLFKLSIAEPEANETRCAVPLPKSGSFLARLG